MIDGGVEQRMKHKTWFRLALKVVGIALIGWSAPSLVQSMMMVVWWMVQYSGNVNVMGGGDWWWSWLQPIGPVLQLTIGLYLLFGGKWIVNLCIPSNRPYCPECGYELRRPQGSTCPECGTTLPSLMSNSNPA